MPVMNIMVYMIFLWFLGIFKGGKQKQLQWSLCRASFRRRTAKWPKPTAETVSLPCVYRGARQRCHLAVRFLPRRTAKRARCRAFLAQAHSKEGSLPCVSCPGARQRGLFAVRFSLRRTAKRVTRRLVPAPSIAFVCRASWKNARQRLFTVHCQTWRTAKTLYRAKCYRAPFAVCPDEKRTAKCLPCVFGPLPCARGARQSSGFPLWLVVTDCSSSTYLTHLHQRRKIDLDSS
jgi:hypothetical protein